MGKLIRNSVARVVSSPPKTCYQLLIQSKDVSVWWKGMESSLAGSYPWSPGTRISFHTPLGRPSWVAEVKEIIPSRLIELYYTHGDLQGASSWEFEPMGQDTRIVHYWRGVEAKTPIGRALLFSLGKRLHQKMFAKALEGMEQFLEKRSTL